MTRTRLLFTALVIIIAPGLVSSCRKDGGGKARGSSDAASLSGTFKASCAADKTKAGFFSTDTRTFADNYFTRVVALFSDDGCAALVMEQEQAGTFELGASVNDGAWELDLLVDAVFFTLHTSSLVQKYNDIAFCGGGWEVGTKRRIVKQECGVPEAASEVDRVYDLVKGADGRIYFGQMGEDGRDGKTEATRPAKLDTSKTFEKVR